MVMKVFAYDNRSSNTTMGKVILLISKMRQVSTLCTQVKYSSHILRLYSGQESSKI